MSLKGLKLVDVERPVGQQASKDPLLTAKQKVIQQWRTQKDILNAQKEGREYHNIDGKKPRRHFFTKGGKYYVVLRYGNQSVKVDGHDTIEAGNTPDTVIKTFDALIDAVESGEMDEHLMSAVEEQSKRLSGARKARR